MFVSTLMGKILLYNLLLALLSCAQSAERLKFSKDGTREDMSLRNTQTNSTRWWIHSASLRLKVLEDEYGFGWGHICSGVLVGDRTVLTAAHCILKAPIIGRTLQAEEIKVVVGKTKLFPVHIPVYYTKVFDVNEIKIHPSYNQETKQSDIALLFLSRSIVKDEEHTLPIETEMCKSSSELTKCRVIGWGFANWDHEDRAIRIRWRDVEIVPKSSCGASNGTLCAAILNTSMYPTCVPEIGAPLICEDELVGIVAGNPQCCCKDAVLYVDVRLERCWFDEQFLQRSFFPPLARHNFPLLIMLTSFEILL